MRHFVVDETHWPKDKLLAAGKNVMAAFMRLQQCDPVELQRMVVEEGALDWLETEEESLFEDLLAWICLVLLPERQPDRQLPELRSLDELKEHLEDPKMRTWEEMLLERGEAKGFAEGRTKGVEAIQKAILLLAERFWTKVPDEFVATIRAMMDLDRLGEILERVPEVRSADELDLDDEPTRPC